MATLKEELESLSKKAQDKNQARQERYTAALDAKAQKYFDKLVVGFPDTMREAALKDKKRCMVTNSFSVGLLQSIEFTNKLFAEARGQEVERSESEEFNLSREEVFDAIAHKVAKWCVAQGFTSEIKTSSFGIGGSSMPIEEVWITFAK